MRSARFDRQIIIESFTESLNEANEAIKTWRTFAMPWAKKTDTGGSERFNGAIVAVMATNFEIRFIPGVTEKMRIKYDGGVYSILGIVEIGRRQGLLIKTERQDHGYNI